MNLFIKHFDEKDVILYKSELWVVDSSIHLRRQKKLVDCVRERDQAKPYFIDIHLKKNQLRLFLEVCSETELEMVPVYSTGNLGDSAIFEVPFANCEVPHFETYMSSIRRTTQLCIPCHLFLKFANKLDKVVVFGIRDDHINDLMKHADKLIGLNFTT